MMFYRRQGFAIVSGGQTGVDRAALDAAIAAGLPYRGWVPLGGWAEDLPEPPGLLALYPYLRACDSANPGRRTWLNVRDSTATLILWPFPGRPLSRGTALTQTAARTHRRPLLVVDPTSAEALETAIETLAGLGDAATHLNVAGPRESQAAGVYAQSRAFMERLLGL